MNISNKNILIILLIVIIGLFLCIWAALYFTSQDRESDPVVETSPGYLETRGEILGVDLLNKQVTLLNDAGEVKIFTVEKQTEIVEILLRTDIEIGPSSNLHVDRNLSNLRVGGLVNLIYDSATESTLLGVTKIEFVTNMTGEFNAYLGADAQIVFFSGKWAGYDAQAGTALILDEDVGTDDGEVIDISRTIQLPEAGVIAYMGDPAHMNITHRHTPISISDISFGARVYFPLRQNVETQTYEPAFILVGN
ncbi:MAG TPA: hypothetical protein PKD95_04795 [Candidatus Paceibacterota bacterium]|nr:hypothetical protein [Candidatus Paceibacterota bacterium]